MIGTKSWRPRRRFSLLPHGERSGRLRSRRPRGSPKFPLPSRRLHRVDSTFLPWAPLPSLRRHAAAGAHFHKLARPSATARLRSHHEQQLLHSGWLGDQGARPHRVLRHRRRQPCLSLRSQHRFGARVYVPLRRSAFKLRASAVGAGRARCRCPPAIPGRWPSASGHRGRSTAVDLNTRVRGHLIVGQGVLLVHCLGAPSLLPHYSLLPVPSPAADDACLRTGQGPFQGRPNRIAARASTSSTRPTAPSRTARRGAEGTEAGNFHGAPGKIFSWVQDMCLSRTSKKKEIKRHGRCRTIRSKM